MTKQWHGGKGSAQRTTNTKQFADNWDRIFNKTEDKHDGNESSKTSKEESGKEPKEKGKEV